MDITSPGLLKAKAALFLVISLLCVGLLAYELYPLVTWRVAGLFGLCVWATCRAYYFGFYVLEHYADRNFRYAGMWDLVRYLSGGKRKGRGKREPGLE